MLLNINFQFIILTVITNSVLPDDYFYISINKLKINDKIKLIT